MNTVRTSRRLAVWLAGLAGAAMLLLGLITTSASAAVVGNPGTFTATWNTGNMDLGNFNMPLNTLQNGGGNLTFTMNVAANGSFTVSGVNFAQRPETGTITGGSYRMNNPKLTPIAQTWSGQIDPATGAFNLNAPLRLRINGQMQHNGVVGWINASQFNQCDFTGVLNAIATSAAGTPYQVSGGSGTVRAVANNFTVPQSTCTAQQTFASSRNFTPDIFNAWGFTGNDGVGANSLDMGLTITPAIKPPVTAKVSASPNPVGLNETVTLDASASELTGTLAQCAGPSTSDPSCGYRWDWENDGIVDEVTNTPTVTHVYNTPGTRTASVTIFDTAGDSGKATVAVDVQTQPVAQIDTHPPATTKETANVFTFSIPTNPYSATTQCSVDGAAFTACDSGDTFDFVQADDTAGSHEFRVRGITPGGVIGPVATYTFTIDRVKPRVTITPASRPANPTNVTSANFVFTADKPGSTLECQLDGGAWEPCGTNSSGTKSYTGLTETPNPHQFRVRATDPYGNVGGDGNPGGGGYDWRVDLTSPVPSFVSKPAQPSNVVSPLITWANDEPVQVAQCRLKVNNVTGPWGNCDTLTSKQYTDLADNNYEFNVRTLDIAGNWSAIVSHAWLLETVEPNLEITSGPPALSPRSLAQFFFDFEENAHLTCTLDGRPVQDPCPSGVKYAYLADGPHTFSVTATDAALNFTTKTYTWSSKTAQPVVAINPGSVPASSSTVNTADFELATANGDAACRLDGSEWAACDSNDGQSYTELEDGNHTFEVRAVDEYGNVSAIDAYSWLVATAAPVVEFTSTPLEDTKESTASFGFDVTSADADVVTECSVDGLEAFDCSDPASVIDLADGDHTFTVTATDTAGIQGSATYEWNVKAKIPGLGFDAAPDSISDSDAASFEFSSDEDPDVAYDCQLDEGDWGECSSPANLAGLSEGDHSYSVRATDSVGNEAIETYEWTVDTMAPTVTFDGKPSATTSDVAELITFHGSEDGVTFECSRDNAAFTSCTSPALLKGLGTGAHTFRVRATDEAGNQGAVATASWSVNAPSASGTTATGETAAVAPETSQSAPAPKSAAAKAGAKKKKAKKAGKKKAKKARKNVKKAKGSR